MSDFSFSLAFDEYSNFLRYDIVLTGKYLLFGGE